jgi:hypothetical protein
MIQPNYYNSDWPERYAKAFGVSMEKAERALAVAIAYTNVRRARCQAKNCPHLGAPLVLTASRKVVILKYLCAEHWLLAVEGELVFDVDIYLPEEI